MKKLFTLMLAVVTFAQLSAQITVTYKGEEVKNGDELVFYADEVADVFGNITVEAGDHNEPVVKKTVDRKVLVRINVAVRSTAEGGQVSFCGFDNLCYAITSGSYAKEGEVNVLGTPMQIYAVFAYGNYGTKIADITVYANNAEIMTFTERFVYDAEHLAIENAFSKNQEVSFDGQALRYNFAAAAPRTLQVFGLDGKLVKSSAVAGTSGSLSLDGLQRGIYVCSLRENGKQTQSRKIVIK